MYIFSTINEQGFLLHKCNCEIAPRVAFMRFILISWLALTCNALKFCANDVLPSGFCPSNAADICAANSGNYCIKAGLQYPVAGVNGCEKFQAGVLTGNCFQFENDDVESDTSAPTCNPLYRNYCECIECVDDADCSTIAGVGADCFGEPAGSGDVYATGFANGRDSVSCVENCTKALQTAFAEIGAC